MTHRKEPLEAKKRYEAPALVRYGTVAELTALGKQVGPGDFFWLLQPSADAGPDWKRNVVS